MRRIQSTLLLGLSSALAARFQSQQQQQQRQGGNNYNNNNRASFGGRRNNQNNQNNNNNSFLNPVSSDTISAKNQGSFLAGRPRFDVYEINDEPSQGFCLRVNYDARRVYFNHYPQLGPRKADPMDPAPQFDEVNRSTIRLFIHEVAGLLTVCDGLASQYNIDMPAMNLTFEPLLGNAGVLTGYRLFGHTINKSNSAKHDWNLKFEGQNAVMLRHFLNSSLTESFGFAKFSSRQNNNNNNGGYQQRRNFNNRNRGQQQQQQQAQGQQQQKQQAQGQQQQQQGQQQTNPDDDFW